MGSSQEILEQLKSGDLADLFKGMGSKDSKNSGGEEGSSLFKLLTGNGITAGSTGKTEGVNVSAEGGSDTLKSVAALLGGDEKIASLLSMVSGGKDGKSGEKSGVIDLLKSQLFNDKGEMDLAKTGGSLGSLAVVASSLLGLKNKEKVKGKEETEANKSDDPMSFWKDISNKLDGKTAKSEVESKKSKKGESKLSSLGKSIKEKVFGSEEKKSVAETSDKKFKISDLNPLSLFKSKKGDTKKEEKGFFSSIGEKITGKNKKEVSSETGKDMKVEEKSKLGQQIDSAKTKLSSVFGKKSDKEETSEKDSKKSGGMFSGLKKEFTNLKESFTKKESQKKSESSSSDPTASSTGGESVSKTEANQVQTATSSTPSPPTVPSTEKSSSSSTSSEGAITPQDIQEIKSLLNALNTTLSGPLMIRDNKPFRPKSSMLE